MEWWGSGLEKAEAGTLPAARWKQRGKQRANEVAENTEIQRESFFNFAKS